MNFNSDELEAPVWLNTNFLQKVLEFKGNLKNVKVSKYKITPATALGDHYASIMFRVKINFSADSKSDGEISVIVKTMPVVDGFKKDLLSSSNIMETEIFMYTNVLNRCKDMLENAGYGDSDLLCANLLFYSMEPHEVLVFEDLKELGYFMIPTNMPSEDQFKIIFAKLAKFHAITFKMAADGHSDLKNLRGFFFNINKIGKTGMFYTSLKLLGESLKNESGFEDFADKLIKVDFDIFLDKCAELGNSSGPYSVLNHGDFHIRNMMFKNNEQNEIAEAILVDFQICHWGSPVADIFYMECMIPKELREKLRGHYFETFIGVLKKLKYYGTLPSFEQLNDEFRRLQILDLLFVACIAPFFLSDMETKDFQMDDLFTNEDFRRKFYQNPKYIKHAKEVLFPFLKNDILHKLIK